MRKLLKRIKLNINVAGLIASGRWLTGEDLARSYNTVSQGYDTSWLARLHTVTDRLLETIPSRSHRRIVDLGCGTGYTTRALAKSYPCAQISAVDISQGMLARCGEQVDSAGVEFVCCDMLDYLRGLPAGSVDLIVSAWSIGYSYPSRIIAESSRALCPGGALAFVVNYMGTLKPVFRAYRLCMRAFPDLVRTVMLPRFPRQWWMVLLTLRRGGFRVIHHEDGRQLMNDRSGSGPLLPWLATTGVLAGFDRVMPILEDRDLGDAFERLLSRDRRPLFHHYVMATAVRK